MATRRSKHTPLSAVFFKLLKQEYDRALAVLTPAHNRLRSSEQAKVEEADALFHQAILDQDLKAAEPFIAWANRVSPGILDLATIDAQARAVIAEEKKKGTKGLPLVPLVDGHRRADYARIDWYHGSRNPAHVRLRGICASGAADMIDPDPVGTRVPEKLWKQWSGEPPMSVARRWMSRGYDLGYSWLGYWREALWNWYVGLTDEGRQTMARTLGWPKAPSASKKTAEADLTADFLGDHLGLIWVSENITTARNYASKGGLMKLDLTRANIFGSWHDDLASGGEEVLVTPRSPEWCPQIPTSAIKFLKE
jgi:hypothetical protein